MQTPSEQNPTTGEVLRWLIGTTKSVLPPLVGSTCARIIGYLLGLAMYVIPVLVLFHAVGDSAGGWLATLSNHIWLLVVLLIVIAAIKAVLRYLEHYLGHKVAFKALEMLRLHCYQRLVPQVPAVLSRRSGGLTSGELLQRLTRDIGVIEVFFAHTTAPVISALIIPTLLVIWAAFISGWFALVLAVAFVLVICVVLLPVGSISANRNAQDRGEIAAFVTDSISGVADISTYNGKPRRLAQLSKLENQAIRTNTVSGIANGTQTGMVQCLKYLTLGALAFIGTTQPDISLALTVALMFAVWRSWDLIDDIAQLGHHWRNARTACQRVYVLANGAPRPASGELDFPPEITAVEIKDIYFNYEDTPNQGSSDNHAVDVPMAHPWIVKDLNLYLRSGHWYSVVGTTGSGKSTLTTLLIRAWDPNLGNVIVHSAPGGQTSSHDLASFDLEQFRSRVCYVGQNYSLLSGTVADNLRLGNPDAAHAEMWTALEAVGLNDEVTLHTEIGDGGSELSGGQRQRLALAQALLKTTKEHHTALVILDEFTAHVGNALAPKLRQTIATWFPDALVVEITHDVTHLEHADEIIVFDAGVVVQQGTESQLRATDGAFTTLVARQVG